MARLGQFGQFSSSVAELGQFPPFFLAALLHVGDIFFAVLTSTRLRGTEIWFLKSTYGGVQPVEQLSPIPWLGLR